MPGRLALQVNVFEPVSDIPTILNPRSAIYNSDVPPQVGLACEQCGTGCESRSCDELGTDKRALAPFLTIETKPEVVRFKSGLPFERDSLVIAGRSKRSKGHSGWSTADGYDERRKR